MKSSPLLTLSPEGESGEDFIGKEMMNDYKDK